MAGTITINARSDTYTNQSAPTTAYNTSTYMYIESNSGSNNKREYFEFDLSTMPRPFCNITSSEVYFFQNGYLGTQTQVDYNWLSDYNWDDSLVTWNNPPATSGTDFSRTFTSNGWKNEDISNYIGYTNVRYSYIGWEGKYNVEEASPAIYIYHRTGEYSGSYSPYLKFVSNDYTTQVTSDVINYDPLESEYAPWFKGHALEVWYTDHNVGYTDFEIKVLLPWDSWTDTKTTISGLAYQTWSSTYTSGDLKWRCYIYFASSGSPPTIRIYEQYWTEDDLYVKTDGNNSLDGRSWANAWKTITVAANNAIDDQTVHIGFGTYNDETDITPDNFSTNGIRYLPETATTGGGTGSVTINL